MAAAVWHKEEERGRVGRSEYLQTQVTDEPILLVARKLTMRDIWLLLYGTKKEGVWGGVNS